MSKNQKLLKMQVRFLGGKIRRIYLSYFRRRYVEQQLKRRQGECQRCGICCRFVFNCPFLQQDGRGVWKCVIHSKRPLVCADFPIDERDLAERYLLHPDKPCGFYFCSPLAQEISSEE